MFCVLFFRFAYLYAFMQIVFYYYKIITYVQRRRKTGKPNKSNIMWLNWHNVNYVMLTGSIIILVVLFCFVFLFLFELPLDSLLIFCFIYFKSSRHFARHYYVQLNWHQFYLSSLCTWQGENTSIIINILYIIQGWT